MDNDVIFSLSFSSYSTNGSLASIAVKITTEFNQDADEDTTFGSLEEDDDFEFSLVLDKQGQIHHHDFLHHKIGDDDFSIKFPLRKLFAYDSEEYSSEAAAAEELEPEIPERTTYCLWRPKLVESSNRWKKQSNSSTTDQRRHKSKVWNKLCDLLLCRSNSKGKGPFVFLNSKRVAVNGGTEDVPRNERNSSNKPSVGNIRASPMELFYVRNKAKNEGGKRKSYLPYRQHLVGLFAAPVMTYKLSRSHRTI